MLAAVADEPALRILHVAALDSDAAPSMRSLLRVQHQVLGGTRRLFRAAAAAELRRPIWVVTRGAQRVTDDGHRVTRSELPCGDSVVPPRWSIRRCGADWRIWRRHCRRMVAADQPDGGGNRAVEDQVALRDQSVYVPRLVRRAGQPTATPLALRDDATYLVTGGLGSIGLEIAGYLAAHGARHLVLTSRRVTQRSRATAHRCVERTARLRIPGPRGRCRRCARRRAPVSHCAGRTTAVGRHRPCRRRDRYHPAAAP